jgi:MYXO-CTERM domain-containing protein
MVPDGDLSPNTRYTVTVSDGALAADGTATGSPYTFRFTTGDPPDLTVPSVLGSYPPDRQREVSPYLEEVTITFSEPMDTGSVESALQVDHGTVTSKTWRVDDTVLALAIDMSDGQRVTVTVGTGATDRAGNQIPGEYTFYFVTKEFEEQTNDSPGMGSSMLLLTMLGAGALAGLRRRR